MLANDGMRSVSVRGRVIGAAAQPLICAPLVATTGAALEAEALRVAAKKPDLLEWRADFFTDIADAEAVLEAAKRLRAAAGDLPIIFTRRSAQEGGAPTALTADRALALYKAVCRERAADLVDFELSNGAAQIGEVRDAALGSGTKLILSHHDFRQTPDDLGRYFREAERLGADIAKVAVMSHGLDDVLRLLSATLGARRTLAIPLMSIAMGEYGSISRLLGWMFGSAVTFAVAESSSAPGQIPIEDLRTVIGIARRLTAGR